MDYITIPSQLPGFVNTKTDGGMTESGARPISIYGEVPEVYRAMECPFCHCKMHVNQHRNTLLKHLPYGTIPCSVVVSRTQYLCSHCGYTRLPEIPFQAENHRITMPLFNFVYSLLEKGLTISNICYITGLNKNTVREIDLKRLQEAYTTVDEDGRRTFIRPEQQARYLGIDEFKLHDGYKFATIIVDLETGHALWIAEGKKKSVVYDFIDHVGMEWMDGVEAVSCDMNSDYQEAFEEMCPHIQPVFDHFHIVKNLNEKVIDEVRKDEQRRLIEEGDTEGAKLLKKTKHILTASRKTLAQKDADAAKGKVIDRGSELLGINPVIQPGGKVERYEDLINQNKLLLAADLVKCKLEDAYDCTDEPKMASKITDIIDLCEGTENKHFIWFANLLLNHFEGIIAHATYSISSGKLEGINNKIKTLRRVSYGLPNDDYFFLKIFDATRKG